MEDFTNLANVIDSLPEQSPILDKLGEKF